MMLRIITAWLQVITHFVWGKKCVRVATHGTEAIGGRELPNWRTGTIQFRTRSSFLQNTQQVTKNNPLYDVMIVMYLR